MTYILVKMVELLDPETARIQCGKEKVKELVAEWCRIASTMEKMLLLPPPIMGPTTEEDITRVKAHIKKILRVIEETETPPIV